MAIVLAAVGFATLGCALARARARIRVMAHYQQAGWFTKNVFNRVVAALTRMGVSVGGSRVLEVPGARAGSRAGRR